MSNCSKCKNLILEPHTNYGINPLAVCRCATMTPKPQANTQKFEHRVGSHSDDRGGESDYPCYCQYNGGIVTADMPQANALDEILHKLNTGDYLDNGGEEKAKQQIQALITEAYKKGYTDGGIAELIKENK